jgi:hypothetical protein
MALVLWEVHDGTGTGRPSAPAGAPVCPDCGTPSPLAPIRRTGRAGGTAPAAPGMIPTISPDASGDKMS